MSVDADSDPDRQSSAEVVARFVVDSSGLRWMVRESGPMPYDRRSRRSLVFDTDGLMRRVYNYPPDWFELPDAELLELSLGY